LLFVSFLIGYIAISPNAQAVSPAPDGGYPGGNTAEGQNALLSLTTGTYNNAVGTRDKPRQGVLANTLKLHRNGALDFIDWLDVPSRVIALNV
jgi:hypothetical protein